MKHFVFDLMGVIFHNGHIVRHHLCNITGLSHHRIKPAFVLFEKGEITDQEFWNQIGLPKETFEKLFNAVVNDFDIGLLDITNTYSDFSYGVMTNMPSTWAHRFIDWIEEKTRIKFVRIVSGDVGILKPDQNIYILAYNSLNIKVNDKVYYFDDRLKNLRSAKKVGMIPVHVFHEGEEHKKDECPYLCIDNLREFLDKR